MQRGVPPLPRLTGWFVAIVATLAMTVSYIDRQALSHLAPTVRDALHINHQQYGTLTGAFSLSYLVGAPLAGWLLDRVGARRGLVVSILVWSLVSALHALAPSFAILFLLRVALGAAEAPSFPGAAQTVRRALPAGDRSAGYGLVFTGSSIGAMIAAPLAIGLKVEVGWRLAFVGTSLCGLLWLPLWLCATGGARKAALERSGSPDETASRGEDVPWREVFLQPAIQRAVLLVFLSAPALMFVFNWYAQLLVERLHQRQDDLWRYLWVPPALFDLGAVGFGALAALRERGRAEPRSHVDLLVVGTLLASALALVPLARGPVEAVVLGGVSMTGGGAIYALATADMMARVSPRIVSRAGGCTAAAQSLAHVLFAPAIGAVLDRTHTYTPVLITLGLLSGPGVIAWALWPMRGPLRDPVDALVVEPALVPNPGDGAAARRSSTPED